jgi:hypothetical protein
VLGLGAQEQYSEAEVEEEVVVDVGVAQFLQVRVQSPVVVTINVSSIVVT